MIQTTLQSEKFVRQAAQLASELRTLSAAFDAAAKQERAAVISFLTSKVKTA